MGLSQEGAQEITGKKLGHRGKVFRGVFTRDLESIGFRNAPKP